MSEGVTTYIDADVHDPDQIITDAHDVLNFNQPIAVMFMGILGHLADYDEARSVVSRVLTAVPSGSYLALYDGGITDQGKAEATEACADTGAVAYHICSPEQIVQFFEGLDMVDPGLVSIFSVTPRSRHGWQCQTGWLLWRRERVNGSRDQNNSTVRRSAGYLLHPQRRPARHIASARRAGRGIRDARRGIASTESGRDWGPVWSRVGFWPVVVTFG
jgi:hypothetical protein